MNNSVKEKPNNLKFAIGLLQSVLLVKITFSVYLQLTEISKSTRKIMLILK